ncbi:MAG: alanine--tRNA ligase, partial [Firmicutes bacterium]|nr:alanine--tRNA ligase [Bacillota bacterium]
DRETFDRSLGEQRQRARKARADAGTEQNGERYAPAGALQTVFSGYDRLEEQSTIALLLVDGEVSERAAEGDSVEIFLDRTPFYAEQGGQIGDSGTITAAAAEGRALITRTFFTPAGQIVHQGTVESGALEQSAAVIARVEGIRRRGVCRSHTATHLLHQGLKELLGSHVSQAGSLVSPDRLRFDFTHFQALSPEEKSRLEEIVNRKILENLPVTAEKMTLSQAQSAGATALFNEKYEEDAVRVISVGSYSKELCGGTHVTATGEIGLLEVLSEEGIGSGMRRIEALTGLQAHRRAAADRAQLQELALLLKAAPEQVKDKVEELLAENRDLERAGRELKDRLRGYTVARLLSRATTVEGINVLTCSVDASDFDELRRMGDEIKNSLPSAAVVLGAVHEGKVLLVASVSPDLIEKGLRADRLIRDVAGQVGGGGGGRAGMAQAGGKEPQALPGALQSVEELVRLQLTAARGD